jgi:putative ABC transport system permease protein
MFKNNLRIAWRSILKNRFYSVINVTGLAIGLAVGIMILLWVQHELSYDRFHKNAEGIYKINSHLGTGGDGGVWPGAPGPLAVFGKQSIPEVLNAVRINELDEEILFKYGEKKFPETEAAFVDSTFFSVFDFKLIKGNRAKPFPDKNSIVISSSVAKRYFGTADPFGKVLTSEYGDFRVSGVMEDFPENSTYRYDILLPMTFYADEFMKRGGNGDWKTIDDDLGNFYFSTFLQLNKDASPETVGKKITKIYQDKRSGEAPGVFFTMQPLTTVHLVGPDNNRSALQTVRIFILVAALILLIACINYVNLSTARSMIRSREVSIRKIIGAERYQLFVQFIIESALIFVFASALALVIIYALLPFYNNISGKNLVFSLNKKEAWIVIGSAIVGTLLMSGIYPALLLSSFKPIEALKGKLSLGIGQVAFRKVLVVTQFVFSAGLIIGTIIIAKQLDYIRKKDVGYNKEYVFSVVLKGSIANHAQAVRSDFLRQPGITGVASSINSILDENASTTDTDWKGKETGRSFLIHTNFIDENLLPLLEIPVIAGRNFSGSGADSSNYILNETAIKQAGINDPIGKTFTLWSRPGTIIGVVKDFNYASLHKKIKPFIFRYTRNNNRVYVKTTRSNIPDALAAAERIWKKYGSEYPFAYSFLDDDFNKLYMADQRTGVLFRVFALVAIIISCLGLFGLATYTAQVRIKEIGIRKVLGASVSSITRLLTKEFILLVLVAFAIASPVTWFLMNKWLQNYAYRINVTWETFAITGGIILFIAMVTVGCQTVKASLLSPVKSLRSE